MYQIPKSTFDERGQIGCKIRKRCKLTVNSKKKVNWLSIGRRSKSTSHDYSPKGGWVINYRRLIIFFFKYTANSPLYFDLIANSPFSTNVQMHYRVSIIVSCFFSKISTFLTIVSKFDRSMIQLAPFYSGPWGLAPSLAPTVL